MPRWAVRAVSSPTLDKGLCSSNFQRAKRRIVISQPSHIYMIFQIRIVFKKLLRHRFTVQEERCKSRWAKERQLLAVYVSIFTIFCSITSYLLLMVTWQCLPHTALTKIIILKKDARKKKKGSKKLPCIICITSQGHRKPPKQSILQSCSYGLPGSILIKRGGGRTNKNAIKQAHIFCNLEK